jgi:hypothetical protein
MNRKNLTAAVLAGLAGAAGIASTAQAVNLNPDGLGQVLIYPYYTVNNGNFTLLSVVNTTEYSKAVKVRFLEGMNSREVLDFNLYMSPYDVWAAAVIRDANGTPAITVPDTSCTVPTIEKQTAGDGGFNGPIGQQAKTQEFITLAYAGGKTRVGDGGPTSIERAAEGHFEMIEMGVIEPDSTPDVYTKHVTDPTKAGYGKPYAGGVSFPFNDYCAPHAYLWSVVNNVAQAWLVDPSEWMLPPTGGLFGGAAVVNGAQGTMYAYDARAIEGWSTVQQHQPPGDESPNLNDGDVFTAYNFFDQDDDGVPESYSDVYARGVDAVSAVFMHDTVMNEYNTDDNLMAMSEWVVTFPTKRYYTDDLFAGSAPRDPFTSEWSDNFAGYPGGGTGIKDGACEIIYFGPGEKGIWNREEETIPDVFVSDDPVFSPSEDPEERVEASSICWETNIIRFGALPSGANPASYFGPTEILGSNRVLNVDNDALGFSAGWLQLNLLNSAAPDKAFDARWLEGASNRLGGLPVTGFWLLGIENNYLDPTTNAIANYGGVFSHKYTRLLSDYCRQSSELCD